MALISAAGVASGEPVDVCVIIVSYNVRDDLLRCCESIRAASDDLDVEIIVVDNASTDGSCTAVRERFPEAAIVESSTNRGFAAAANLGLALARGAYVLFLNPDTIVGPGSLAALVGALRANPNVGVVGPRLRYADGQVQSSRRREPTLATALIESTVAQRWWPTHPLLRRYYVGDRSDALPQEVEWLVGACLLTRREVIETVGGFDERFFMYSEELDWCRRVRQAGWRTLFWPDAEIQHYEGRSSEQNLARRAIVFNESKCRYFEKYYGPTVGRALRLYLLANTAHDLTLESLKLAVGHRPGLRRSRVQALSAVAGQQLRSLAGVAVGPRWAPAMGDK